MDVCFTGYDGPSSMIRRTKTMYEFIMYGPGGLIVIAFLGALIGGCVAIRIMDKFWGNWENE